MDLPDLLDRIKPLEHLFHEKFPGLSFRSIITDTTSITIHCVWEQYTIPRSCVLVFDIKFGVNIEFNPFESQPRASDGFDWIRMYYIESSVALKALEGALSPLI